MQMLRYSSEMVNYHPVLGVQIWCPRPQKSTKSGKFDKKWDEASADFPSIKCKILGVLVDFLAFLDFRENSVSEADVLPLNYSRFADRRALRRNLSISSPSPLRTARSPWAERCREHPFFACPAAWLFLPRTPKLDGVQRPGCNGPWAEARCRANLTYN